MNAVTKIAMPPGIAALPRTPGGIPIPWFVQELEDGKRDFRIVDGLKIPKLIEYGLCWICGRPVQRLKTFVLGPMAVLQRFSTEPPSHHDCATYAARVCPFLSMPSFEKRGEGFPADGILVKDRMMADHNPGITCLWTTQRYRPQRRDLVRWMFFLPEEPTEIVWYREGRQATPGEIRDALIDGFNRICTHPNCGFSDEELARMLASVPTSRRIRDDQR